MTGRLTKDPTIRGNSVTVAAFSIAVDRKFKKEGEPQADFFYCTAFSKQAEFAQKYLSKGMKIELVGHIQNDEYENKKGETVKTVNIICEELGFAESKKSSESKENFETKEEWMNIPDNIGDELPFA